MARFQNRDPAWRALRWPMSEIRRLGDWGNASNHLGRAWELYAAGHLLESRGAWRYAGGRLVPAGFVSVGANDAMLARLSTAGLRGPDGLVVGRNDEGDVVLLPVDFKFSLDHADAGQVKVDVSIAAVEHLAVSVIPAIETALGAAVPGWQENTVLGSLVSPPSNSNQTTPVRGNPSIRWLPVTANAFFPGLPATNLANWLREWDRTPFNDDFDLDEAYYRLAAGVGGAISRLDRPLFAIAPPGEVALASIERIRATASRVGARSTFDLVEELRPLMVERRAMLQRLGTVLRRPVDRDAMNKAVGEPLESTPDVWSSASRRASTETMAWDKLQVLARGNALLDAGESEDGALSTIQGERKERARRFLTTLREFRTQFA